jgi:hypothetical protein
LGLFYAASGAQTTTKKPALPVAKVTTPPKTQPPAKIVKPPKKTDVTNNQKAVTTDIKRTIPPTPKSEPIDPRKAKFNKPPTSPTQLRDGKTVRTRNGKIADLQDPGRGLKMHTALTGRTRVVSERGGTRIVAERGGRSSVQRRFIYGDHDFARRTSIYNGRTWDSYYAHANYHNVNMDYYRPAHYYPTAYYGYAYNPWSAPVPYAWGWSGNPASQYYGAYFTPAQSYASPPAWLTDYMLSTTLAAAYQANASGPAPATPPADAAPITPQVKTLITGEVQRQIALENTEAQSGTPTEASSSVERDFTDNIPHIFVAGSDLDVIDNEGSECSITEGDALQLSEPPPANAQQAKLVVLASKGGYECKIASVVAVGIEDLQEMRNHMRETIDAGLEAMRNNKALPAAPLSASGPPVNAAFVAAAPPPDPNAAAEINQQLQGSEQAEKSALAQLPQAANPPGAP